MKKNNYKKIFFLLLAIILISNVQAITNYQTFNKNLGVDTTGFWQINQKDSLCQPGGDMLLEIMPGSCSPSIVRSDLLESQNVPIFCPITGIKLNPLVDIGKISSVSFTGNPNPASDASVQFNNNGVTVNKKINDYVYGEEKGKNWANKSQ